MNLQNESAVASSKPWGERAEAVHAWLVSLASAFISELDDVHWVSGEEETLYCRAHANAVVNTLHTARPQSAHLYRVCNTTFAQDTPVRCEKCGKLLQYSLTLQGLKHELDRFEAAQITRASLGNDPDTTYQLSEVLDSGLVYLVVPEEPEVAERLKRLVSRIEILKRQVP